MEFDLMHDHNIFHALVLNFHQPAGNLEYLLAHKPWEAYQILYSMDRVPRSLWKHEGMTLRTVSNGLALMLP